MLSVLLQPGSGVVTLQFQVEDPAFSVTSTFDEVVSSGSTAPSHTFSQPPDPSLPSPPHYFSVGHDRPLQAALWPPTTSSQATEGRFQSSQGSSFPFPWRPSRRLTCPHSLRLLCQRGLLDHRGSLRGSGDTQAGSGLTGCLGTSVRLCQGCTLIRGSSKDCRPRNRK